jgi:opacity protein-like surface antigen
MRTALLSLLLAACTGIAAAQPALTLQGNLGATSLQGPDQSSAVLNSGVNLALGAQVRVYRGLGLVVEGSYDQFTINDKNVRLYGTESGDLSFLGGTVGLRYTYENDTDAHPYVGGGIGRYRVANQNLWLRQEDDTIMKTSEETRAVQTGYHMAFGTNFRLNDTYAFFFEPRYVIVDTERIPAQASRFWSVRFGVAARLAGWETE